MSRITLSKEYGVNPSVTRCIVCGKEYGIALFGTSWKDKHGHTTEAPREVFDGLCEDCQKVVDAGGVMIIEVRDGETSENPYRTGRIIGLNKDFKERNHVESSICYMEHSTFEKLFSQVNFK